ncbi:UNVERIFIED_CONTAM: hypothetical protein NCL1_53512 [Trichonephila clavipes]
MASYCTMTIPDHILRVASWMFRNGTTQRLYQTLHKALISLHAISGSFLNLRNHYEANIFQATKHSKYLLNNTLIVSEEYILIMFSSVRDIDQVSHT